jgi:hypothetical protein
MRPGGLSRPRLARALPRPSPQFGHPAPGHATEIHNYRMMRGDSVAMGAISAATTFLPVFVARLGGSAFELGLLTAIPAVCAVVLAIPVGQVLQQVPDIVRWYSRSRMLAHLAYAVMAIAVLLYAGSPPIGVLLVIWAFAAVPSTIGSVAFPVVMDGVAGPRGRLEIMARRWSIMGLTTAVTVALVGQLLGGLPFPNNYALLFAAFSAAGIVSWHFSRQYRVAPIDDRLSRAESITGRVRAMVAVVRSRPAFLHYSARQLVYIGGVRLTLPLIPLYYVRSIGASDAWIGIIATSQSLALLAGYLYWRRASRIRGVPFVLLATLLVSALYPALLSLIGNVLVVAVVTGGAAFFAAGVDLSLYDELMRRIPRDYGVTFTAIDTTLVNLATIVAPLTGGAIAAYAGIHGALQLGSLVTLAGFVLFAFDAMRAASRATDPTRA